MCEEEFLTVRMIKDQQETFFTVEKKRAKAKINLGSQSAASLSVVMTTGPVIFSLFDDTLPSNCSW